MTCRISRHVVARPTAACLPQRLVLQKGQARQHPCRVRLHAKQRRWHRHHCAWHVRSSCTLLLFAGIRLWRLLLLLLHARCLLLLLPCLLLHGWAAELLLACTQVWLPGHETRVQWECTPALLVWHWPTLLLLLVLPALLLPGHLPLYRVSNLLLARILWTIVWPLLVPRSQLCMLLLALLLLQVQLKQWLLGLRLLP